MPSRHHREKPVLVSSRLIPYLSRVHQPPSSFLFSPSSDPRATSLSVLPSRETRTRSAVSFFADPPPRAVTPSPLVKRIETREDKSIGETGPSRWTERSTRGTV